MVDTGTRVGRSQRRRRRRRVGVDVVEVRAGYVLASFIVEVMVTKSCMCVAVRMISCMWMSVYVGVLERTDNAGLRTTNR